MEITVCSNFFSFVSRYNFQWLCTLFLLNCLFLQNCAYAVVKNNILKKLLMIISKKNVGNSTYGVTIIFVKI